MIWLLESDQDGVVCRQVFSVSSMPCWVALLEGIVRPILYTDTRTLEATGKLYLNCGCCRIDLSKTGLKK